MRVQLDTDMRTELLERLRFETLLADISARFVNVPATQVDYEIEEAQRAICECLGLDHCSLWQVAADNADELLLTHLYRDPDLPPRPARMSGREFFPWVLAKLEAKEIIVIPDTSKVPLADARDRETWQHFQIKSTLAFPLSAGGNPMFGALSFDATRRKRDWPEPLEKRLQMVAEVFANALERKNTDQKLRESEARLQLAVSAANAGLWTLEEETGEIWATAKLLEVIGVSPEEVLNYQEFLVLIHSDDREMVRKSIHEAIVWGKESSVTYRMSRPDGTVRWLATHGRRHCRSGEEPCIYIGITTDITESRRVQQEHDEFAGRLLSAQEAESARIARELHDDLGQSIALFAVQLHTSILLVQKASPGVEAPLQELRKKIGQIGRQVSTLSHQLHSSELDYLGLAVAARGLCRDVGEQHGRTIVFSCEGLPERLAGNVELCLFRVLQESLNNFVKHSQGKRAEVKIGLTGRTVQLTVSDDGIGFDSERPLVKPGLGLISMEERMRLVGGEFAIRSKPGNGTTVEARVSLSEETEP